MFDQRRVAAALLSTQSTPSTMFHNPIVRMCGGALTYAAPFILFTALPILIEALKSCPALIPIPTS